VTPKVLVPVRAGTARGVPSFVTIVIGSAFAERGNTVCPPIVAEALVKPVELKSVRFPLEGPSAIHSTELRCALSARCVVAKCAPSRCR
jgi:hypothetical protein